MENFSEDPSQTPTLIEVAKIEEALNGLIQMEKDLANVYSFIHFNRQDTERYLAKLKEAQEHAE